MSEKNPSGSPYKAMPMRWAGVRTSYAKLSRNDALHFARTSRTTYDVRTPERRPESVRRI